jgi:hypothetical protein
MHFPLESPEFLYRVGMAVSPLAVEKRMSSSYGESEFFGNLLERHAIDSNVF